MTYLSFKLDDNFIEQYADRDVAWGDEVFSQLVYLRTYSRKKEDGTKERWHETCRRVIEGTFSIQKDHVKSVNTPWEEDKAQRSAKEMYDKMFNFKWWPPGRGIENMGTTGVNEWGYSDKLYNCAFQSTMGMVNDPVAPFTKVMMKSMRGVGCGFDTNGRNSGITIQKPQGSFPYNIPDTTEGWVNSLGALLKAYFLGSPMPHFGYEKIRPAGAPINSGGVAPGPVPLMRMHGKVAEILNSQIGNDVTSRSIVDLMNLIGKAVASGGRRRSALLALGNRLDEDFISLKDWSKEENKERTSREGWAWSSNNSIRLNSTDDFDYDWYAEQQVQNGEPGLFFTDIVQKYGRVHGGYDPTNQTPEHDPNAIGTNPCGEISLEDDEVCNLNTINLMEQGSLEEFLRTIKFAYLYSKTVTLLPTSWPETNAVVAQNRRIGCSVSGTAEFVETYGWQELRKWLNAGYDEVRYWDNIYSRWFGVRESIKVTTSKPEGTVSQLTLSTPGVHYPVANTYVRRMRFNVNDPLLYALKDAGYKIEPAFGDEENTYVVDFPVHESRIRTEPEVSVYEKMALAVLVQEAWSDNMVSCTLSFHPSEKADLASALKMNAGKYKSISCLPIDSGSYTQMPYESIKEDLYVRMKKELGEIDFDAIYGGAAWEAESGPACEGPTCSI